MICPPCRIPGHAPETCEDYRRGGCTCQHGQPVAHTAMPSDTRGRRYYHAIRRLRAELETPAPDMSRIVDSLSRVFDEPTSQETQP